jgi:glycerophosphoryl diester phosphodiesterase
MIFSALGCRPPKLIAHRGASATYPENTLAAFDAAVDAGCDGIELDVQLSRDAVPVVYHDRTLRKIGAGTSAIGLLDLPTIGRLDAGSWFDPRYAGERIPSLDRVLKRYAHGPWLLLELKISPRDKRTGRHVALAEAVAQVLRRRRCRRVMVLCFDLETLELVAHLADDLPTVLNLKAPRHMTRSLRSLVNRISALSLDIRTVSADVVSTVHALGKPVFTYTCNGPRTLKRALSARVDGVMTDRPLWLRHELERTPGSPAGTDADAA